IRICELAFLWFDAMIQTTQGAHAHQSTRCIMEKITWKHTKSKSGQRYVESCAGSIEMGTPVFSHFKETVRRGGVVVPEHDQQIGTITSAGTEFKVCTKNVEYIAGVQESTYESRQRFYF
ncbi:MAG: hypothetical protein ACRET1_09220, partial [Burkholderiales bacterium]